jgi:phenylpropionate dioxygenase-like ring-hydroxylating dioxygenase large terminal subunit
MNFAKDPLRYYHPVLPAAKLRDSPAGVQVADTKVVLFRDREGRPQALLDRCPHRFTPLSLGVVQPDGKLACAYHGWAFDGAGRCRSPQVPDKDLKCTLRHFQVVERFGYLWIANPEATMDRFPAFGGAEWTFLDSYTMRFQTPLHVAFDNFSEDEHFPYVHRWFGWNAAEATRVQHECRRGSDFIEVVYHGPQRPMPGQQLFGIRKGSWVRNGWRTRFDPLHSVFTSWFTDGSSRDQVDANFMTHIAAFMVPVGDDATDLTIFHFVRFPRGISRWRMALLKRPIISSIRTDLSADARFTQKLKDVPYSLDGAVLGRFDKALVHGRDLLERLYFGQEAADAAAEETADSAGEPEAVASAAR